MIRRALSLVVLFLFATSTAQSNSRNVGDPLVDLVDRNYTNEEMIRPLLKMTYPEMVREVNRMRREPRPNLRLPSGTSGTQPKALPPPTPTKKGPQFPTPDQLRRWGGGLARDFGRGAQGYAVGKVIDYIVNKYKDACDDAGSCSDAWQDFFFPRPTDHNGYCSFLRLGPWIFEGYVIVNKVPIPKYKRTYDYMYLLPKGTTSGTGVIYNDRAFGITDIPRPPAGAMMGCRYPTLQDIYNHTDIRFDITNIKQHILNDMRQQFNSSPIDVYNNPNHVIHYFPIELRPNINQLGGSPYVDIRIDTDGDGWADAEEADEGTDYNDPTDHPKTPPKTKPQNPPLPAPRPLPTLPEPRNPNAPRPVPQPQQPHPDKDTTPAPPKPPVEPPKETPKPPTEPPKETPEPPTEPPKEEPPVEPPKEEPPCKPEEEECQPPEKPDETEYPDSCGDMSAARLRAHPYPWVRDLVVPCAGVLDNDIAEIVDVLEHKFPFSVALALRGVYDGGAGGGDRPALPDKLGMIPLDWGWADGLWALMRSIIGVALYAWFVAYLVDRYSPRTVI